METPKFSVSQFLASLNQTLEYAHPVVEVEGEISSYKVNQGKYIFFDLKDESSTVNCFASVWQIRMPIEDGMKVLVVARPKFTAWGKFSLTIQAIKPLGDGALKRSQDMLKAKLEREGLFDQERKRSLPKSPQSIAVISSTGAAGYADFIKILSQRTGGLSVQVAHVQVQGEAAPAQIVRAVEHLNQASQLAEVLVLIRGGGSQDDLAAWSDERVVRAIAGSRIPTLVGIGHETDVTLADLAADVRAATPSNAAQIVVLDRREIIDSAWQQVDAMTAIAAREIASISDDIRRSIGRVHDQLKQRISDQRQALDHALSSLNAYDPQRVLERGYALVRGKLNQGEMIEIETARQIVTAEVTNVAVRK